jgi:hypothetical protein
MKPRSRYYRAWMEWREPRRYGVECTRILTWELTVHAERRLGTLVTFEDATRVRSEGEASYAAAIARARVQMEIVRRRIRRAMRR